MGAELSRRGCVASITLRNTRGIDVLASNANATKSVGIQVKTNQCRGKEWQRLIELCPLTIAPRCGTLWSGTYGSSRLGRARAESSVYGV